MYTSFFGLTEKPFAITPDPRYLYLSERHAEALAHLLYGINEAGGFIQLTGEVGTGKTTVVRTLLSRIPRHADVAVIMNPRITATEFLLTICEELGVALDTADRDSVKQMVDALNRRLLAAHADGRRVIVIVDEAQNLSTEVLEQVRLLTNLETATQKLLQIILIGQPELRVLLDRTELRQLAQRITGRYHLSPLSREETMGYVRHRLKVAGAAGEIFTPGALRELHRLSAGIPRVINVCCDRALLGAYTRDLRKVTAALVRRAASEVYGRRFAAAWIAWLAGTAALCGAAVALVTASQLWMEHGRARQPTSSGAAAGTATAADALPAAVDPAVPQPAPPAVPAAAAPSINSLLAADPGGSGDAEAFRRLFALWGTTLFNDKDPCGEAKKSGLACFEQRGSWAEVRMLNRPAILTLIDDQGLQHRVLLTGLDEQAATLAFGDQSERIPLAELSKLWYGEFTVVWKPKTRRTRELSVGMSGEEVRWLRRSLNTLHPSAAPPASSDLYDTGLATAVQNFQREHRLNANGIAGIQTQVVLETALADPDTPLLAPQGS
jgi:general secretion pathway protein A